MLSNIENLIVKYLTNAATANDLDRLSEWIEEPSNKKIFKEYVKVHYAVYYSLKESNSEDVLNKLLLEIRKEKSFVYKLKLHSFYKYVAVFVVGLMAAAYVFMGVDEEKDINKNLILDQNVNIEAGTDKAILTLADGSQVALGKGTALAKKHVNSNGVELIYNNSSLQAEDIKYNYLTIPRGGQFFVKLADGTQVWMNSDSQLKYPVSFRSGKSREVELIYGEAYFDVSPSINHDGAKFIVFNKSQKVEVLGTEFNINAYPEDSNIYTTLVEGKVAVSSGGEELFLKPSEQLLLNIKNNNKTIKTVEVQNEISWRYGVFSFENMSLKRMMLVLSRWYDIEIEFKNKEIQQEEFIGVLRKNQDLEEILTNIKNFGVIKNFEITNGMVTLE